MKIKRALKLDQTPLKTCFDMRQIAYKSNDENEDVDECASLPCKNGGTCADMVNGYICTCNLGYTGLQCEENIDECASTPCQNGGTCADLINRYTCTCDSGYKGILCDENIDECASSPCQHGGICTDGINGYMCTCVQGYSGSNCEENYDECSSNPCQHDGTCTDLINGYTCNCYIAYKGNNCEESNDLFDVNYKLTEHTSTYVYIKVILLTSRLNCARSCTLNHDCYGFKYNATDKKCQMISASSTSHFGIYFEMLDKASLWSSHGVFDTKLKQFIINWH
ncbi:fibropellin-3-like [Mytilus edulis]|uniref:fibropellin-3-like n=1 Tax=Mytilus edulis TaxID=6550 RepID=UPI0039F03A9E